MFTNENTRGEWIGLVKGIQCCLKLHITPGGHWYPGKDVYIQVVYYLFCLLLCLTFTGSYHVPCRNTHWNQKYPTSCTKPISSRRTPRNRGPKKGSATSPSSFYWEARDSKEWVIFWDVEPLSMWTQKNSRKGYYIMKNETSLLQGTTHFKKYCQILWFFLMMKTCDNLRSFNFINP